MRNQINADRFACSLACSGYIERSIQVAASEDRNQRLDKVVVSRKQEAILATWISSKIAAYLESHDLGQVLGPTGR